LMQGYLCQ